ncbi:aldehyde oxidase GLOX1-like [Argentina anserina]|uniref:aldehyde oxidase GLOX1-like n=1 Tax=Argentina anserina TaxID=57926 RepID=UPI002176771A|nr:aldehyde oxidase GLOX1-like [Potentilla anserina]XP_050364908.1 aldehyde oxidase GLOX1-like [Potentilla anserina]
MELQNKDNMPSGLLLIPSTMKSPNCSRLLNIPLTLFFNGGEHEYFKAATNPNEAIKHEKEYRGRWELVSENSGVSAMHMIIMPKSNKAIIFYAAGFGPSEISLPAGDCRRFLDSRKEGEVYELDCWAHAVEFDIDTAAIRPLKILTDTWCSSGGLSANGTLVQTGGWDEGGRSVRYFNGCSSCDWEEYPLSLSGLRWFSTQHILPNGEFIVIGGRGMFNYEYIPKAGSTNEVIYTLPFLQETSDAVENNLYPFVFLSTDGNLLIFANNRSILLNPTTNKVERELPVLDGGSRNYPASGMAALLPLKLNGTNPNVIRAEILVCGGADPKAGKFVENGIYVTALQDCGRIDITNPEAKWQKEMMPTPRVMGDMVILPTGDILIINGAKRGTAGLNFAEDPNVSPVIYKPDNPLTRRFTELKETIIPRMYGSTSALLPGGEVLVAGSNPNFHHNFTGVKYPTELRIEKFYPRYFDPERVSDRVAITSNYNGEIINYRQNILIEFQAKKARVNLSDLRVTMYAPPFTTHGFSMGQRLIELVIIELKIVESELFQVEVVAPPIAEIAPPGFYLIFVVHVGVPSRGIWLQIA